MNKMKKLLLLFVSVMTLSTISVLSVSAGERVVVTPFSKDGTDINAVEWNSSDDNIVCKDGKLLIPAETSTDETKFISKQVAKVDSKLDKIVSASATMKINALPQGEKFILALGLQSIDALPEESGNVEVVFTNDSGLRVSVVAYDDEGEHILIKTRNCGISLKKSFAFEATIDVNSRIQIKINGQNICNEKMSVSGEGRFGIIQTGGCGAEFSALSVEYMYYDRPENTNIEIDFEDGEWNANLIYATMGQGHLYDESSLQIEEYNNSKVLMFRGSLGSFCTMHQYSNFELSFDVPYILRDNIYDKDGFMIDERCYNFAIGFGEEHYKKSGTSYVTNVELITFNPVQIHSEMERLFTVRYEGLNLFDPSTNDGFSVKLTVVDGNATLQAKALESTTYQTIATATYENFRSGYVSIWNTANGNFAIDNFKIINLDEDPKLVEVDYKSSVITAEDYVWTDEDTKMIYREADDKVEETINEGWYLWGVGIASVVVICVIIILVCIKKRNKQNNGGAQHEEK